MNCKRYLILLSLLLALQTLTAQPSRQDLKKIDEIVTNAFSRFGTTGLAVAVVYDSAIVYNQALGFADRSSNRRATTSSLFNIASCTKAFTAAAVAILVDEGKIRYTDKVRDYIPEFRLNDDYISKEMTVEDLLCHRSGLGTFFGDLLWYGTTYTNDEIIKRMQFLPVTRRFGIEYGYQNNMFMIAGEIIERVTGKTWEAFLSERVLSPLSMVQTRPSPDMLIPGQEIAYGHIDNEPLATYMFNATRPAASMYSSTTELANWTIMLLNQGTFRGRKILSPGAVNKLMTPNITLGVSSTQRQRATNFNSYGLGWFIYDHKGTRIVHHDGGMPGYISKVLLVPDKKYSIIILNNGNDGLVNEAIKGDILDVLLKGTDWDWTGEYVAARERSEAASARSMEARAATRKTGTTTSLSPEGYAGLYRDKMYGDAEVRLEGADLILTLLPAAELFTGKLEHWHYNTFKVVFKDKFLTYGLITFSFNSAGAVDGFKIDLPSADFHFWNLDFKKIPVGNR
jgi:CubicO group peptidase (beta-lactamase class C family)